MRHLSTAFLCTSVLTVSSVFAQAPPAPPPTAPTLSLDWLVQFDGRCMADAYAACLQEAGLGETSSLETSTTRVVNGQKRNYSGCADGYADVSPARPRCKRKRLSATQPYLDKVFACRETVASSPPSVCERKVLTESGWRKLIRLETSQVVRELNRICLAAGGTQASCDRNAEQFPALPAPDGGAPK